MCGAAAIKETLLELSGYKVIPLLYTEYKTSAKLLDRAKHIDGLLKTAASPPL